MLRAPADRWGELTGSAGESLIAAIRGAGFRYVALDLDPDAGSG